MQEVFYAIPVRVWTGLSNPAFKILDGEGIISEARMFSI
jgi:hypothetical protein